MRGASVAADDVVSRNEFSDLYNEVGPDNVGGMGSEPACTVTLFSPDGHAAPDSSAVSLTKAHSVGFETKDSAQPNSAQTADEAAGDSTIAETAVPDDQLGASPLQDSMPPPAGDLSQHNTEQPVYRLADQVECDPHKVVAIRPGQQQQILLGMSNDVDCAVVGVKSSNSALVSDHIHTIPALAYVAAGESCHPVAVAARCTAHCSSQLRNVPGFICVFAGKIHKKFTLLGHPESRLAAAVIEGHRFSYVYKHTTGRQRTGDSQVAEIA